MEHEIRQNVPIFYYNIWDDRPTPRYNEFFYESCDLIMNISKQTVAMVKDAAVTEPRNNWNNTYIPHGIPEDKFYPIGELDVKEWNKLQGYRNTVLHNKEKDFVVFWNNRNIRRKLPSDVILAYKTFCDMLPKEQSDKCVLIMHTQPVDQNGTDLPEVVRNICPDYEVIFSHQKLDEKELNYLYNMADVQVNIASNEGFGLGTAEAVMSGTPIVVNVTGGLQDQCGFKIKGKHVTPEDYDEIESFHDDRKWKDNPDLTHGEWVKPVWPSSRSLQGSIPTPYIFDDRCRWDDVADRFKEWYDTPKEERREAGQRGREWMLQEEIGMSAKLMCERFIHDMEVGFEKWTPRKRFTLYKA
jgi:glycosyltransferase involved in cell wall biosynthesis